MDHGAVGYPDIRKSLCIYHIHKGCCDTPHGPGAVIRFQILYNYHFSLVNRSDIVTMTAVEKSFYDIDYIVTVPVIFLLDDLDRTLLFNVDMELFRLIIDIHKEKIIKKEILEEGVFVEFIPVGPVKM